MALSPTLRFVLGDQLTRTVSSLSGLDPERDVVFMAEVPAECTYVKHHMKKIAFILSAMRHFARELEEEGVRVDYRTLDASDNQGDFTAELAAAVRRHGAGRVVVTEPGEWRVLQAMSSWEEAMGVPLEIRPDRRFLFSRSRFQDWAEGRKSLRMEHFYREMRRETGLLMGPGGKPEGGEWNFDMANRKRLPNTPVRPPQPDLKKERSLRYQPGAEGQGHAGPGSVCPPQPIQDEENRG